MKLRVLDNSFRLRLSQSEVEKAGKGEEICNETVLSISQKKKFVYRLVSSEISNATVEFLDNSLVFSVPKSVIFYWATGEEISMDFTIDNGSDSPLKVLIEKDFKCLTPRAHEDESDLFPHPEEKNLSC